MKKNILFLFFVIFLSSTTTITAQTPQPARTPPVIDNKDVVIITTNLIQLDATVTDKKGNIVTDLTADDFEVYENGKLQPITNFSFVQLQPEQGSGMSSDTQKRQKPDKNALPLPPVPQKLKPEQVRRTMALVVDDLGLSFASVKFVKDALRRFVDEQMQPGDLVAIVRTGGGMGALQQFTSDKRILYAAIEKLRFNLNGRVGISSFEPIRPTMKEALNASMNAATGETTNTVGTEQDREFDIGIDQFREDVFSVGTLGAVNYTVRGMRDLPGRKAITLFSEGFSLIQRNESNLGGINPRIETTLRELTNLANRASVIIYAIDPRGLVAPGFTAEDDRVGLRDNPFALDAVLGDREEKLYDTQQSLRYLSEETGGFAVINQNDMTKGISRVLNDQKGYYLLGYQPDDEVFDPAKRKFNKLVVKLKRPDLKIRYRSGFFGITDLETRSTPKNQEQKLLETLTSPFAGGEMNLSLTTFFASDAKSGSSIRSLIHVEGDDLKFVEGKPGWKKATFEVLAVTFGDNGQVIDTVNRMETIEARDEAFKEIQEKGLVYSMTVPVKKPGAYQLRIAMRDTTNFHVGSASEFIEVPNLKKKRVVLSGLVLESSAAREKQVRGEENIIQSDTPRDITVRRFPAGSKIFFGTSIYNAKSSKSRLVTQYRIFQGNREIYLSPETPLNLDASAGLQSLDVGGAFEIGKNMMRGDYVLQVIVKDLAASGKDKMATEWIDFEIIK